MLTPSASEPCKLLKLMCDGAIEVYLREIIIAPDKDGGIPVITAYSKSKSTNWSVVIGIPVAEVTAGLRQTATFLVVASVIALMFGLLVARFIGVRIVRSVLGLIEPTRALGSAETVTIPLLYIKEAEEMAEALREAATTLHQAQCEAHHDVLTGLPNRTLFRAFINRQLALCRRDKTDLSLLYIDLDGFKQVNDVHGHTTGDHLLRAVSSRIMNAIRDSDIAARLGGDEFSIALLHANIEYAQCFAHRFIEIISMPYQIGGVEAEISASVGIAGFSAVSADIDTLLTCADCAMYKAKVAGKRRVCVAV